MRMRVLAYRWGRISIRQMNRIEARTILGIEKGDEPDMKELKAIYIKKAKQSHPDISKGKKVIKS